jgi:hypothetical protein
MKTKEYFIRTPEGRIYTTDTPQHWKDSVILKHKEGREAYRAQAKADLLAFITPGQTIHCILRHVAKSGMSRRISLFVIQNGEPRNITGTAAVAMDRTLNRDEFSIVVGGCGMDMGWHLVYSLSRCLFPDGFGVEGMTADGRKVRPETKEHAESMRNHTAYAGLSFHGRNGDTSGWDNDGGYALKHRWL